jgi:hypothetical protein
MVTRIFVFGEISEFSFEKKHPGQAESIQISDLLLTDVGPAQRLAQSVLYRTGDPYDI